MPTYATEDNVEILESAHPALRPLPGLSCITHVTGPAPADALTPASLIIRATEAEVARWSSAYYSLMRILEVTSADVPGAGHKGFRRAVWQADYQRCYALRFYLPFHEEIERRRDKAMSLR